jgi:hypothetical protein
VGAASATDQESASLLVIRSQLECVLRGRKYEWYSLATSTVLFYWLVITRDSWARGLTYMPEFLWQSGGVTDTRTQSMSQIACPGGLGSGPHDTQLVLALLPCTGCFTECELETRPCTAYGYRCRSLGNLCGLTDYHKHKAVVCVHRLVFCTMR